MEYSELMKELGARLELEEFQPDEEGNYRMCIDDAVVTFVELPAGGLLNTVAKIGELPEEGGDALCRVLLSAMAPAAAADAYSFYLATDGKSICLRRTDALPGITADGFLEVLERYADALAEWRKAIGDFRQALPTIGRELERQAQEDRELGMGSDGFLRV